MVNGSRQTPLETGNIETVLIICTNHCAIYIINLKHLICVVAMLFADYFDYYTLTLHFTLLYILFRLDSTLFKFTKVYFFYPILGSIILNVIHFFNKKCGNTPLLTVFSSVFFSIIFLLPVAIFFFPSFFFCFRKEWCYQFMLLLVTWVSGFSNYGT